MDTKARILQTAKQRRSMRGVAMVEGAVIFPIMAGFLVMFELSHHTYDGYLTAGHVARERAWSAATAGSLAGGCDEGARDDQTYKPVYFTIGAGSGSSESQGPQTVPSQDKVAGIGGADSSRILISKHSATATASVTVHRGFSQTWTPKPTARSVVYCNQPFIGGLTDIISKLFSKGGG